MSLHEINSTVFIVLGIVMCINCIFSAKRRFYESKKAKSEFVLWDEIESRIKTKKVEVVINNTFTEVKK